jgi:hypothetical protein
MIMSFVYRVCISADLYHRSTIRFSNDVITPPPLGIYTYWLNMCKLKLAFTHIGSNTMALESLKIYWFFPEHNLYYIFMTQLTLISLSSNTTYWIICHWWISSPLWKITTNSHNIRSYGRDRQCRPTCVTNCCFSGSDKQTSSVWLILDLCEIYYISCNNT